MTWPVGGQRDGAGGLQAHREGAGGRSAAPPRSRQQAAGSMPFGAGRVGELGWPSGIY